MIKYIFASFFLIGIVYAFFSGNVSLVNASLIQSGENALSIVIKMIPLLCLWLGIMKIAEKSGLLTKMSQFFSFLIGPLFPDLNRNDETLSYIGSNIVMNVLGLGNAATPFGLKAFQKLQEKNLKKDTATRSMITLLVINTASVTLIPTTVISFRTINHSSNPTEILLPCILTTFLSCLFGLILDRVCANYEKRKK